MRYALLGLSLLLTGCAGISSTSAIKPSLWIQQEENSKTLLTHSASVELFPSLLPLLEGALADNGDIQAQLLNWTNLYYTSENIASSTLPVVDLTGNATKSLSNKTTTLNGALALTGVIDIFGRIHDEGLSAKKSSESAWWQYIQARNAVINNVIKKALSASYAHARKDVLLETATLQFQLFQQVQRSYNVGRVTQLELYKQEKMWRDAVAVHITVSNEYHDIVNQLMVWTGKPREDIEKAILNLHVPALDSYYRPISASSVMTRPDVSSAWTNAESASYARLGADKSRYPVIALAGQWTSQNTSISGVSVSSQGVSIGPFSINIPLWDNGVIARKQKMAAAKEYEAWGKVSRTIWSALTEYEHNVRVLKTASQEFALYDMTARQAERQYKNMEKAYAVGKVSRNEVIGQQLGWLQARITREGKIIEWWQNYADMQYSIGAF